MNISILSAAITLFLVMDPIGNIPVFMSILSSCDKKRRRWIILREMIIALAVLVLFLFFGEYILSAMRISGPSITISGGVILFIIALRMIFPGSETAAEKCAEEPLIVPLAIPLIAGPTAVATVILIATEEPGKLLQWLLALVIAWTASSIILVYAESIFMLLGRRFIDAMQRLMGMILTTMAVQMLLNGIGAFLASSGH